MNILILGTFLPKKYEFRFKNISAAANQFQYNMFLELRKKHNVKAVSHISVQGVDITKNEIDDVIKEDIYPFFPKNNGYKDVLKFRSKVKDFSEWADLIITYNVVYPWLFLRNLINNNKCRTCLIFADYTPINEAKGFKKVYAYLMKREYKYYDKVVLLSENSKVFLPNKVPYVVVNGCVDKELLTKFKKPKIGKKIIISYTGFLSIEAGIPLLLEAFHKIENDNIELWISGQEYNANNIIKEYVALDDRIKYNGYLSKEQYFDLINRSHILVNPRDMSYKQNKYNFPSKILEYIASGRVIVSTKFPGYEKYKKNVIFVDSNVNSLFLCMIDCIKNYKSIFFDVCIDNVKFIKDYIWESQIEKFL